MNNPCRLITLKIRQNSLLDIKGNFESIEAARQCFGVLAGVHLLKSLEELDISDNFITDMPEEIRELTNIKRVGVTVRLILKRLFFSYTSLEIHLHMQIIIDKLFPSICPLSAVALIERFAVLPSASHRSDIFHRSC